LRLFLHSEIKLNSSIRNEEENEMLYLLIETLRELDEAKRRETHNGDDPRTPESACSYISKRYFPEEHTKSLSRKTEHFSPPSSFLFKKLRSYFSNIPKLMHEISRRKLLDNHTSFHPDPKPEAAELLVIMEAVGVVVGFEFMVGLGVAAAKREYYNHKPGRIVSGIVNAGWGGEEEEGGFEFQYAVGRKL
jgi:hypothetical protein